MGEMTAKNGGELLQLVTFTINEEEYGIEILKVQEIIRTMGMTKVPNAPLFVEGLINLRGKVIPIINLRTRFNLERRDYDAQTRIVVIEIHAMVIGFVVDSVSEVLRIAADTVEPAPLIVSGIDSDYIKGVGKLDERLLLLLDLEKLLSQEELHKLKH
jgi:purine-binding chemotaxis protein CheW